MDATGPALLQALQTRSAEEWARRGERAMLALFRAMAVDIPAYRDVLKKHRINPEKIRSWADVVNYVPILDKEQYIHAYPHEALVWRKPSLGGGVVYASSGTTGMPTFWVRRAAHDREAAILHDALFRAFFYIDRRKTLVVDCFALGIHVAGFITATAVHALAEQSPNVFLATPGSKKEDIVSVLVAWAKDFEQVILVGYPPLIKDVVNDARRAGVVWSQIRTHFLFAAQGFSEAWRAHVRALVSGSEAETTLLNIFGSADLGAMAFETPHTIALRNRIDHGDISYSFALPAGAQATPYLFQFIPEYRFIEAVREELVVSGDNGIPLLRYNIHDIGGVIQCAFAAAAGGGSAWQLPIVYLFGRSNHAAIFFGANIYPEHVRQVLETQGLFSILTGRFVMEVSEGEEFVPALHLHIELGCDVAPSDAMRERLFSVITDGLCRINREFAVVFHEMGNESRVIVGLHAYGAELFAAKNMKHAYIRR